MSNVATKVAVIGSGISGAVCASTLARNGVSVTLFDSARGPGGRMSQRREIAEDGKELLFDHGAPFFSISNTDVLRLVHEWELKGLVAEWKENFGSFDYHSKKFIEIDQDGMSKRYVGVPGMNSICKALCNETGVESKFGVGVGRLEWLDNENSWLVMGMDGQNHGSFKGVVASDKSIFSSRFKDVTGSPPPLDLSLVPELAMKLQDIPVNPCFALMLAFTEPLSLIPVKGFSFKNSEILSWAHCDSSKPGRSTTSERWVLHSTSKYARDIISQTGLRKPSAATLTKVAEDVLEEFKSTGLNGSQPFFRKVHRWGSAFPAASVAGEEKCLWDDKKKLGICGDFCVSPNVEGAILSGLAAAAKLIDAPSCL
ncbi:renalase isoform X2 [Manihot esculenta]|uniref:Amine oxidase domain-containing protein n=1 Tax=Manihot esculenta TaxID=3983 RepID=A0A2C9W5L0_MANES|nr:renalase isoform X2 [Manihot esculenta]OAY54540.1 hypothetical protein MANES_03G083000v8 [Manihot esculenta]